MPITTESESCTQRAFEESKICFGFNYSIYTFTPRLTYY